jgi:hypothetical protein
MTNPVFLARRYLAAALSLAVLLIAGSALAGGRVEWKSKTLKASDNHSWTIEVSIFLNAAPDVPTLPMRFSFQPVIYYERAMVDGKSEAQFRKVPLEGKPPLVESVDVGFLDPSNGTTQKRTKFSFKVSRGQGYEAGEYDVTIKDGRTDASLGGASRIIFDGENEIIDRRAVVFSGEKKEKKEDTKKTEDDAPQKKQLTPDDPGFWQGGKSTKDEEKEEEVDPKRGCGCRVGAASTNTRDLGTGLAGVALVLGALRRRGARSGRVSQRG